METEEATLMVHYRENMALNAAQMGDKMEGRISRAAAQQTSPQVSAAQPVGITFTHFKYYRYFLHMHHVVGKGEKELKKVYFFPFVPLEHFLFNVSR